MIIDVLDEQQMGSQTLEILRQGVWASLTGGWFYDPHQDVFCNTFHLYVWLFLLCLPFTIYVYFPPTRYMWYFYCISVTMVLAAIKLVNYGLHHMYDTSECIQEEVDDSWPGNKRDDEGGIELQVLSNKAVDARQRNQSYAEACALASTDGDSVESTEFHQAGGGNKENKPSSTIDLKAEVHRKNSSESSDGGAAAGAADHDPPPPLEDIVTYQVEVIPASVNTATSAERKSTKKYDRRVSSSRHQRSKTDCNIGCCTSVMTGKDETDGARGVGGGVSSNNHRQGRFSFRRLHPQDSTDSQDGAGAVGSSNLLLVDHLQHHRPSLQSVDSSEQELVPVASSSSNNLVQDVNGTGRRHSNFTNSSLGFLPSSAGGAQIQEEIIKPTQSLELGYIDKNPNQALTSEGFYFKSTNSHRKNSAESVGVRRIRSTALETCCPPPPPPLTVHPNSLEVIGCKSNTRSNPPALPPPSSSLVRNQHLNLCAHSYYGSEIVYPIAEQSDEHQTSHGPDTDLDDTTSAGHVSDSDFEQENIDHNHVAGSSSPLFFTTTTTTMKTEPSLSSNVPYPTNHTIHNNSIHNNNNSDKSSNTEQDSEAKCSATNNTDCISSILDDDDDDDVDIGVDDDDDDDLEERTSATSKDALLLDNNCHHQQQNNENTTKTTTNSSSSSNGSSKSATTTTTATTTPEMQDARTDLLCCEVAGAGAASAVLDSVNIVDDNEVGIGDSKKLSGSECSTTNLSLSNTSVDGECSGIDNLQTTKRTPTSNTLMKLSHMFGVRLDVFEQSVSNVQFDLIPRDGATATEHPSESCGGDDDSNGIIPSRIRKRNNARRNKKRKSSTNENAMGMMASTARKGENNCSSLMDLDLDWLFDDATSTRHLQHRKEPLKRDNEWSSTTTMSLEHDVSKVLQDPVIPSSARSLGAIPKKSSSCRQQSSTLLSNSDHHNHSFSTLHNNKKNNSVSSNNKAPKSESEKCSMCRCKSSTMDDNRTRKKRSPDGDEDSCRKSQDPSMKSKSGSKHHRSMTLKENKVTQTLHNHQLLDSNSGGSSQKNLVEGLECLVLPNHHHRMQRVHLSRRSSGSSKPNNSSTASTAALATPNSRDRSEEASSSGSNNELSSLLPPAPFLSAFLTPRNREFPVAAVYLPPPPPPPPPPQSDNLNSRFNCRMQSPQRTTRLKRGRVNRRRSSAANSHRNKREIAIASTLSAGHGTHSAKNFNDTTDGSVHCFMDEHGNWITYTFDEKGLGTANTRLRYDPLLSTGSSTTTPGDISKVSAGGSAPRSAVARNLDHLTRTTTTSSTTNSSKSRSFEFWDSSNNHSSDSICCNNNNNTTTTTSSGAVSVILDAPPPTSVGRGGSSSMIPTQAGSITAALFQNHPPGGAGGSGCRLRENFYRRRLMEIQHNNRHNSYDLDGLPVDDSLISMVRGGDHDIIDLEAGVGGAGPGPPLLRNPHHHHHQFKFIQPSDAVNNNTYPRTRHFYKFRILPPWLYVKVSLDRLKLLALLDRNLTLFETLVSIFLGISVGVLGSVLLYMNFYQDLLAFIFCFIMASCQYSLLKSVQPDAASPTHGFNRIIAYSRPIYFCLFCAMVLVLHDYTKQADIRSDKREIYGLHVNRLELIQYARDFLASFILFFPILFSLGLFPQINTFVLYLLEQLDMHMFGGNAMSSLLAAFYCVFRSLLAVFVMFGFAYLGLSEPKSSQHLAFSLFCACLVACSYHLSRSASDPSYVWNILKTVVWPSDIYREHTKDRHEDKKKSESSKEEKPLNEKKATKNDKNKDKTVKFSTTSTQEDHSNNNQSEGAQPDHVDPLPQKLQKTVKARLKNDLILCALIALLVFGVHSSTVFTALQPELSPVLWCISAAMGFFLHYCVPQLRKQLPWMCIARPVLRSKEWAQYQIREPAKIMWYEKVYVYLCFVERNILYPLLFLSALTEDSPKIAQKFGTFFGSLIVVVCGLKCLRMSYSDQSSQYMILSFTALFFRYDNTFLQETFLVQYFFMAIVYHKVYELILKVQFVVTYIAPWQITWGSAFHAFAQPFSVPHSAMLFLQAIISAFLSTPLNPFLGSAIFLTSYVRPVKFWERDYNTRRVDHSNTPLSSHLDRNLGADDNNLNSIFYEHLTRSLQHSLCGDLVMGRWGAVNQGDCFVMASDYLNCLVHVIELGNGLVTFQMRGLEFRGTYCQQREVEAITEGIEENESCCCIETNHFRGVLSVSAAFSQRWLAWEVTSSKYVLEGYSISDNSAASMLQVFEFRKVLISYYVKSIIFYTVRSPKLEEWLTSQTILKALHPMEHKNFVDLDPVFNFNIDEDFDMVSSGMTRNMFCQVHGEWISFCVEKAEKNVESGNSSTLMSLCFALSLLGRRALGAVSHNTVSNVEFFLYGLHALFKGDFRITCARDEWVFTDMDLLKTVVAPGVRMSLKLHQDHFMSPDEYEDAAALFDAICRHEEELVISHEGDPAWRNAVLSGTPSLLALRHVLDDGTEEYKIIMLNKRYLSFRVIKINKECVRGLWAGQQQELVYLRNRNPERGSIQNAKQALRNIINSSCDQPIGYPIYVSPLTTSYAETNEQYRSLVGGSVSFTKIKNYVFNLFRRIRKRCGEGCSSGASTREEMGMGHEGVYAMTPVVTTPLNHQNLGSQQSTIDGGGSQHLSGSIGRGSSLSRTSLGGNRGSLVSVGKPTSSTLASLAGLFKERDERAVSQTPDYNASSVSQQQQQQQASSRTTMPVADERLTVASDTATKATTTNDSGDADKDYSLQRVRIIDPNLVYDGINLGRRIDVSWPTEYMRVRGGRSSWKDWVPEVGMEGPVVHRWTPCHKDPGRRSHVDRTILLVQIDDKYVPIAESGVQDLGQEV